MKKVLILIAMLFSFNTWAEDTMSPQQIYQMQSDALQNYLKRSGPSDGEILSVWAGYIIGAYAGAGIAANATATSSVIGHTAAGTAITAVSVPMLPIIGGAIAGAIVGSAIGYYSHSAYVYYDDNKDEIKGNISSRIDAMKKGVIDTKNKVVESTKKLVDKD
jgi:hypothetical protein